MSSGPAKTRPANLVKSANKGREYEKQGCYKKDTLFERLVFSLFEKMPYGHFVVELPDGRVRQFGGAKVEGILHVNARIRVKSARFFKRAVLFGHVGASESFMDGEWETDDIASVIAWFLLNVKECPMLEGNGKKSIFVNFLGAVNQLIHALRANTKGNSRKNISYHYDLSNQLFELFLDSTMTYSSALFSGDRPRGDHTRPDQSLSDLSLAEAQLAKYDALCLKLKLKESDHVLEIGSGWGGFAMHAVKNYGCRVTGLTISKEQLQYARARIEAAGLSDRIELRLMDYRNLDGRKEKFDKIVSIEMIEAVGDEFMDTYFAKIDEVLAKDGILALQMITCPDSRYDLLRTNTDFIQKHIFPGSLLPSLRRVTRALQTSELFLHDLCDMGNDYACTLVTWQERFENQLREVRELGFDDVFIAKWRYYLSYCAAAFAMRNITVVQAVYVRPNNLALSSKDMLERFERVK